MRITGNRIIDISATNTAKQQEAVGIRGEQVSSGLRVTKPSDDPTAYAAAERAKVRKVMAEGTGAAVSASRDRLGEADNALSSVGDILSQVRQLAVQGANGSYNAGDRAQLGEQVSALFKSALSAANTQSSNGEYLLAGSQSLVAPFDATGKYVGDDEGRGIPAGENATQLATVPGSRLTAAYGVDVMPLMESIARALKANDVTGLQAGLGDLATAIQQVGTARTVTGSAMNVLDSTIAARDALSTHLSTEISRNIEIDAIDAASALAKASQSLEASRTITSHLVALLDPRSS